jgi:hypothetical protein
MIKNKTYKVGREVVDVEHDARLVLSEMNRSIQVTHFQCMNTYTGVGPWEANQRAWAATSTAGDGHLSTTDVELCSSVRRSAVQCDLLREEF